MKNIEMKLFTFWNKQVEYIFDSIKWCAPVSQYMRVCVCVCECMRVRECLGVGCGSLYWFIVLDGCFVVCNRRHANI